LIRDEVLTLMMRVLEAAKMNFVMSMAR